MSKLSVVVLFSKKDEDMTIIESLQKQTLRDVQIIVRDNLLDEKEKEKLKKYGQVQFPLEDAIQISELSGEYVTFLTSEHQIKEEWAEKMYQFAKDSELDIAICGMEEIERKSGEKLKSYIYESRIEEEKNNHIACTNLSIGNKIFRKEILTFQSEIKLSERGIIETYLNSFMGINKIGYLSNILCYRYIKKNEIDSFSRKDIDILKELLKTTKETYKINKKYDEKNKELLSAVAFMHLGVECMYEISKDLSVDFKQVLKETINYLDINFFEWRSNKLLSSSYIRKQYLSIWFAKKMYKMGFENLYMTLYKFWKQ